MKKMIIVEGILASCYAACNQDLAHFTMTPLQRFSEVLMWLFGDDSGFAAYVRTARELDILLLQDGHFWSC